MEIEGGEQEILLNNEAIILSSGGGNVDDVFVNGISVVENKIADIKLKTINNQAIEGTGNIQIDSLTDYNELENKPQINGNILSGDKSGGDLGLQNYTDNDLSTTNKTIVGAINEVDNIAKGANQALSFSNYGAMITEFNSAPVDKYKVGQNIYVLTLDVPDLWVSSVEDTSVTYTYTTDAAFISALNTNGYVQVGYYKLSALETQEVDLTDYVSKSGLLQSTGTAIDNAMSQNAVTTVLNGKADISVVQTIHYRTSDPTTSSIGKVGDLWVNVGTSQYKGSVYYCSAVTAQGTTPETYTYTWTFINQLITTSPYRGIALQSGGMAVLAKPTDAQIDNRNDNSDFSNTTAVVLSKIDYAVKKSITTSNQTLTDIEKANAQSWLGITPTEENYTIATTDWSALSNSSPYTYSATVTATYTIGNDTEVGIINDQPVLFANYGFVVGEVSGQSITIYSIDEPDASVTLSVGYRR